MGMKKQKLSSVYWMVGRFWEKWFERAVKAMKAMLHSNCVWKLSETTRHLGQMLSGNILARWRVLREGAVLLRMSNMKDFV